MSDKTGKSDQLPSQSMSDLQFEAVLDWIPDQKREAVRETLAKRAVDSSGHVKESWAWLAAGDHFYHSASYDEARVCYHRAFETAEEPQDRSRALFGLGNAFQLELDPIEARAAYRRALAEADDSPVRGEIYNQLASVERTLGDFEGAEASSVASLTANISSGRAKGAARSAQGLAALAAYFDAMGRRAEAKDLLASASAKIEEAGLAQEFCDALDALDKARRSIIDQS